MMHSQDDLKSLRDMGGHEVSREDQDVRGWSVIGTDGQRLGTVRDLIVDTTRMKVEYLEVEGDGGSGASMAVPVASAQLDTEHREVVVARTSSGDMTRGSEMLADQSDTLAARSRTSDAGQYSGRDRTTLRRAEEELRIGKREVAAGEVVVGKHVETERVSEPVTVERERVRVERRPVSDSGSAHADLGADEIRVPVIEEELIVEKRPVVKEELVISKERVQETEMVDTDLRREEFDVRSTPDNLIDDRGATKRRGGS